MTLPRSELVVAALLCLALAVAWALPVSLDPAGSVIDGGDPLHLAWVMAWDAHQVVRAPWRLFESNTFYPYRQSLAFGDHLLPEALLVAPVNWLTGNAVLASNVALLLGLSGAALAMYVLLRRVTGSRAAGAAAAACWAFNSFTHFELARVQVLQLQWWPLALLALVRAVETGSPAATRWFAALVVLQGLSSSYYMVYSALAAPLWWVSAYAVARRKPTAQEVRALAVALLVALPFVLALSWPYLTGEARAWREKDLARGIDLLAYLTPPGRAVPGWPAPVTGFASAFAGYITLALAAVAIVRRREWSSSARVLAACAAIAAALGLLLSLGPDLTVAGRGLGPGPYRALVAVLPFLKAMDGTQRASVLVLLGLSLLAGLGAASLEARLPARARTWAAIALVAVLAGQHWQRPGPAFAVPTGPRVPPVYRALAGETGPLVELPLLAREDRRFWSSYLYFSSYHWRPIPFGRTSFYPPAHDLLAESMADFPSAASVGVLQRLGITTVVVHPKAWPDAVRAERLVALDAEPALTRLAAFPAVDERYAWLALGEERLYRLAAASAGPPCTPADPLSAGSFTVTGKSRPAGAGGRTLRERWRFDFAADGDLRTAFATERPQMPGDVLDLTLAAPRRVAAVTLALGRRYGEFPRGLALLGEDAGGTARWLRVSDGPDERWADVRSFLDGREARITLRLNPRELRRLQLLLRGEPDATLPEWSVAEVALYGDCR